MVTASPVSEDPIHRGTGHGLRTPRLSAWAYSGGAYHQRGKLYLPSASAGAIATFRGVAFLAGLDTPFGVLCSVDFNADVAIPDENALLVFLGPYGGTPSQAVVNTAGRNPRRRVSDWEYGDSGLMAVGFGSIVGSIVVSQISLGWVLVED